MYNVNNRYSVISAEIELLVGNYNKIQASINDLQTQLNQLANQIVSKQGILEELKPYLDVSGKTGSLENEVKIPE